MGGILRNEQGIQECAHNIAQYGLGQDSDAPADPQASPIELSSELVQMRVYKLAVEANAQVIHTVDEMLGELIDTFA